MANNILASGVARFNGGGNNQFISFEYNSVVIGENSGKSLNLSAEAIIRNYHNTFVGYASGQNSASTLENTFIGFEAGQNIQYGSNNILLGRNYNNQQLSRLYDAIAIGLNNKPGDSSTILGTLNMDYGYQNIFIGNHNIGNDDYRITNIGIDNFTSNLHDSIIFGNNNVVNADIISDYIIVIGNNNIFSNIDNNNLLSSSPIFIGNSLYDSSNYIINVGDSFLKYDNYVNREIIQIGTDGKYYDGCNIPLSVGFGKDDIYSLDGFIEDSSHQLSLYVKSGIYTDSISLGSFDNISNFNISLSVTSNLTSNIEYILPDYPVITNPVLSTNEKGEMFWRQVDISNSTTDSLRQGTSNLYYDQSLVDARMRATFYDKFEQEFSLKMSQYNTDNIIIGTSNKFIENGIYNSDMYVFGTLTVNRLRVLGVDVKNDFGINDYINDIVNTSIGELDERINQLSDTLTNYVEIVSSTPFNDIIKRYIDTSVSSQINSLIPLQNILWQKDVIVTSELDINNIPYKSDAETTNIIRTFDVSISNGDVLENSVSVIITYNSLKVFTSITCHKYFTSGAIEIVDNTITFTDVVIVLTENTMLVTIENNKIVSILSK